MRTNEEIPDEQLYTDSTRLKQIFWHRQELYIYANKNYEDSLYNCDKLDFEFDNHNLTKIVNEYFNNNYKFKKSCFNKEVDNIFRSDHTRTVAFRDTFEDPKKNPTMYNVQI
jgi:hypothetical protein